MNWDSELQDSDSNRDSDKSSMVDNSNEPPTPAQQKILTKNSLVSGIGSISKLISKKKMNEVASEKAEVEQK